MKKMFQVLLGLSFVSLSASAFAQDYYVPIKKELEEMARIPLKEFKMDDATITYTLPQDITGRKIDVLLNRDAAVAGDLTRIYRGDKAEIACMGSDELPACVVTHKDLGIDKAEAEKFLRAKYRDETKFKNAKEILEQFASGSQPLGVISKRSSFVAPPLPRVWRVEITQNMGIGVAPASYGFAELNLDALTFGPRGDGAWPVSNLNVDGNHIAGDYFRANQWHWFDITINTERTSAEGTWGFIENGSFRPASGELKTGVK